jgi:hypothetical protein
MPGTPYLVAAKPRPSPGSPKERHRGSPEEPEDERTPDCCRESVSSPAAGARVARSERLAAYPRQLPISLPQMGNSPNCPVSIRSMASSETSYWSAWCLMDHWRAGSGRSSGKTPQRGTAAQRLGLPATSAGGRPALEPDPRPEAVGRGGTHIVSGNAEGGRSRGHRMAPIGERMDSDAAEVPDRWQ